MAQFKLFPDQALHFVAAVKVTFAEDRGVIFQPMTTNDDPDNLGDKPAPDDQESRYLEEPEMRALAAWLTGCADSLERRRRQGPIGERPPSHSPMMCASLRYYHEARFHAFVDRLVHLIVEHGVPISDLNEMCIAAMMRVSQFEVGAVRIMKEGDR